MAEQIIKIKQLIYKSLSKLERMNVDIISFLRELNTEFMPQNHTEPININNNTLIRHLNNNNNNGNNNKIQNNAFKIIISDDDIDKKHQSDSDSKSSHKSLHTQRISLLTDLDNSPHGICEKGHALSKIVPWNDSDNYWTKKCYLCGFESTEYLKCYDCFNFSKAYYPNLESDQLIKLSDKYIRCFKCPLINKNKITKQLRDNTIIVGRLTSIYNEHPHIHIDLLTGLENKRSLKFFMDEIIVNERKSHYILYLIVLNDVRYLKEFGKLLKRLQRRRDWKSENTRFYDGTDDRIGRIWSFRQDFNKFAVIVKHSNFRALTQHFYNCLILELSKQYVPVIVTVGCAPIPFYDPFLTSKEWMISCEKALNEYQNDEQSTIGIWNHSGKRVELFTDIKKRESMSACWFG